MDPGDEAERIDTAINELDLTVIAYPTTHGHVDHVGKLAEMRRRHEAPIGMHPLDAAWAFSPENALPPWFDAPENPGTIERKYEDGQTWEDGNMPCNILFVPGHSPGSLRFTSSQKGFYSLVTPCSRGVSVVWISPVATKQTCLKRLLA